MVKISKIIHTALLKFVAKSDCRYALSGVLVENVRKRIVFCSTDTHRLIMHFPATENCGDVDGLPEGSSAILTKEAFQGRSKVAKGFATIDLDGIRPSEEIDGQFPRYREIMPKAEEKSVSVLAYNYSETNSIQLRDNLVINMKYIVEAGPMIANLGGLMYQSEPTGAISAEIGKRPWEKGSNKEEYTALIIMPIHSNETIVRLEGFPVKEEE